MPPWPVHRQREVDFFQRAYRDEHSADWPSHLYSWSVPPTSSRVTPVETNPVKVNLAKIVAFKHETELLKLQMQSYDTSSNNSSVWLIRPMSVPFVDLVHEVYKYLPEPSAPGTKCPRLIALTGAAFSAIFVLFRCVAQAHSSLLGVAVPEEVPPNTRPSSSAMSENFFTATGHPPSCDNYKCSRGGFAQG